MEREHTLELDMLGAESWFPHGLNVVSASSSNGGIIPLSQQAVIRNNKARMYSTYQVKATQ